MSKKFGTYIQFHLPKMNQYYNNGYQKKCYNIKLILRYAKKMHGFNYHV